MATLDRMLILGVRAFSTQRGETIKFEPPLTLVAGINGSGKTTIIECLKFAATGMLPPFAAKGGAWLHDPGLENEREVMAQVKLEFHAANGTRLVATRNLQLTVKKGTRSQKTLEATLLMDRHGQKTTLSTRVAELDQQVPAYLGVSTSLLENVIFCHQEDSLWPLAESSVLKKKFDEIFEAGKYTKAVKELLDIRKKHKADIGRQEALAEAAKRDRDRSVKMQKRMETLHKEAAELRNQAKDLQEKMDNAQKQANQAWTDSKEFSTVLSQLDGYQIQANATEERINHYKSYLKELPESDEWLQKTLAEFDQTLSRYREEKDTKKDQWLGYDRDIKATNGRLSEKLAERGRFEQEKREYERNLERRKQLIKENASKHQMRGFDDLSDESKVEEFLFKIKKVAKERATGLERVQRDAEKEKREGQTLINQLTEREKALKYNKEEVKLNITSIDREVAKNQTLADDIGVDEGKKAAIESRISESETQLANTRKSAESAQYSHKIKTAKNDLATLEEESASLNRELVQGTKRAGEVARLTDLKKELKEKDSSLSTLSKAHGDRISAIVGDDWTPPQLEARFKRAITTAMDEVSQAQRERDGVIRESEQIQFKQNSIRGDVTAKKRKAEESESAVVKAIDAEISEYEEILSNASYRLELAREEVQGLGGLGDWFGKVLQTARTSHACRMCERKFRDPDDPALKKFMKKLEGLVEKASAQSTEEELNEATEEQKRIADAGVSFENWKRLTNEEIPSLESQLTKLGKEHDAVLSRIESHDSKVEAKQSAQKEVESISSAVSSITETVQQITKLKSQVEELTAKQSQHGEIKSLDDIQEEMSTKNDAIQKVKKTISRLIEDQERVQKEMYQMELELSGLRNELGNVSHQLDQKTSYLSRVAEHKSNIAKQRETINKVDADLEKIGPEKATANAKYDDLVARWQKQVDELGQESTSISETVRTLNMISDPIQAYIDEGGEGKLPTAKRDIERLQQEIGQLESAKSQLTVEINQVEKHLSDSDNTRRHYVDNINYREEKRNLKTVRARIEELDAKNAQYDCDRLQEEAARYQKQHHQYSAQREGVVGELKSKDNQLGDMIAEYNTDLKDAGLRYKEAHIKLEATKGAIEDIGKYSTALDQAVTKYHTIKMDQVNSIIGELWQQTYQGTDVDTLYIKSDLEVKANSRSHNYRVVMLKRDIELDMRGRCSAGQKVLASIIIRLALAECFSSECGIIALDEPTTNLDERNIEALAQSLHKIIQARKNQKNFQLVVITHDEKFLAQMQCSEFTDWYYQVSRDPMDNSVIERRSILEIMR